MHSLCVSLWDNEGLDADGYAAIVVIGVMFAEKHRMLPDRCCNF